MKLDNAEIVSYVSIAVIVISLFFIGTEITGFAVTENETGLVNVTITTSAALNFTTALLDFGSGYVTTGLGATLQSNGTGLNTSWSGAKTAEQLVLENIGNVNVSLTLSTNKSVDDFIGGTSPTFKAMTADTSENTGACTGTETFDGSYADIDGTLQTACSNFGYGADYDSIDIDFELYIPSDALGAKTVGIIAIGTYTP
ncbi:MAG: hypothetical protein ABIF18_00235 [archaeon]